MIGESISHYRIIEKLGAGGMGEVFLAEDSHLSRRVAIKVLPDAFTKDPERLARFDREARLLASLSHPNIAAIHGLEKTDGSPFLVMELVEGETLAQHIAKGPLAVDESLEVCRQIAEGLEAAHAKDIIHRDLKPANVKVTPEGKVKILDFGLAKALADETQAADATQSPTITEAMTRPGVVLGTPAYMSPEQAKGGAIDKRADIWAFGCILYECLTGKRAFEGETITETLAAILKGEPDWKALPTATPSKVMDLLHRCLEKDPRERLHDIADARIEISHAAREPIAFEEAKGAVPARTNRRLMIPIVLASLAVCAVSSFVIWKQTQKPKSEFVVRFPFVLPASQKFTSLGRNLVAVSPDGSHLAYVVNNQLFLRPMYSMEALPIHGTEGFGTTPGFTSSRNPFFSPDGKWVGFYADYKMQKISISGGKPVPLCDCPQLPSGASWAEDDTIVYGQGREGIWQVPGAGGQPKVLIRADPGKSEVFHGPQLLKGGKYLLFTCNTAGRSWDNGQIMVQSLETGKRKMLFEGGTDARYISTGYLVYVREGSLLAVPFDLNRLEKTGEPVEVIQGVMQGPFEAGTAHFSVSDNGTLAYVPISEKPLINQRLVWANRQGSLAEAVREKLPFSTLRLSPDGRRLAVAIADNKRGSDLWIYDLSANNPPIPLMRKGCSSNPVWTPKGDRIVFSFAELCGNPGDPYWISADGSTFKPELLIALEHGYFSGSFIPDGKQLLFWESTKGENKSLILQMEGTREVRPLLDSEFSGSEPMISPDGRWLAYKSNRTGQTEVWITSYPDLLNKRPLTSDGASQPRWSHDSKELYYRQGNKMMAVAFDSLHGNFGRPTLLFEREDLVTCDVAPDGRFLLCLKGDEPTDAANTQQINIVLNWFEELKRLCPTGKK